MPRKPTGGDGDKDKRRDRGGETPEPARTQQPKREVAMSEGKSNRQQVDLQARVADIDEKIRIKEAQKGTLIYIPPRTPESSIKLEQNLGCELPVCVASRKEVYKEFIEVKTEDGVIWRLERKATTKLPAPEHYSYWLWFLDRCQAAYEANHGCKTPPRIVINPIEIFDLFGGQTGGSSYKKLHEGFYRFSSLIINAKEGFFDKGVEYRSDANLGTLCTYQSWRNRPLKSQETFEFAKGWVAPGEILWASICSGYLKSVPLKPIGKFKYIGKRLYTYLSKHCKKNEEFVVSPLKLLPKIPANIPLRILEKRLYPHHDDLAREGFLKDAVFDGKGKNMKIIYKR